MKTLQRCFVSFRKYKKEKRLQYTKSQNFQYPETRKFFQNFCILPW